MFVCPILTRVVLTAVDLCAWHLCMRVCPVYICYKRDITLLANVDLDDFVCSFWAASLFEPLALRAMASWFVRYARVYNSIISRFFLVYPKTILKKKSILVNIHSFVAQWCCMCAFLELHTFQTFLIMLNAVRVDAYITQHPERCQVRCHNGYTTSAFHRTDGAASAASAAAVHAHPLRHHNQTRSFGAQMSATPKTG